MTGTTNGFSYGVVTPVAAYVMACLGAALGLRCIVRSVYNPQSWKPGWLMLGAASIGCGIWTMHFIAMIGFRVAGTPIRYHVGLTVLSLVVAVVVVGIGVFAVGYRGGTPFTLTAAGIFTGLGVAAMHYLGMAAIQVNGVVRYDPLTVALSVGIAIVAATAALWAAVSIRGFSASLGASLVMGVAVTGMHYTGMAAMSVHLHDSYRGSWSGGSATSLLLPMLIGPIIFLVLAGVVVMFDPLLVLGDGEWSRTDAPRTGPSHEPERIEPVALRTESVFGPPARRGRSDPPTYGAPPRGREW
ncbi:putative integral membrane sensor protein [Actinobacteria bacterium OK074]|nr:putative integral membrane sensor protein [Actinobacteria bacterium OK074]